MNKSAFRWLGTAAIVAVLSVIVLAGQAGAQQSISYGPYAVLIDPEPLSGGGPPNGPPTEVKIVWRTSVTSTNNTAYYRLSGSSDPWTEGYDTNDNTYHEVAFTGLSTDTTYEFKVATDGIESLVFAFSTGQNVLQNWSFEAQEPALPEELDVCDAGIKPVNWQPWEIFPYQEQPTYGPSDHVHATINRPTAIPTPAARDRSNRLSIDEGWRACFGGMYQTLNVTPGYYQISGWMAWLFDPSYTTLGIYAKDGEHVNPKTTLRLTNLSPGATTIFVNSVAGFKVPGPGETCAAFITKKTGGDGDAHGDTFYYTGINVTGNAFTGVTGVDYSHDRTNALENEVMQVPVFWDGNGPAGDKWQPVYTKSGSGGTESRTDWAYGEKIVYCSSGKLTIYCNLKSTTWYGTAYSHYDGLRVMSALEPVEITNIVVAKGVDPVNPDTKVTISWETSVPTATYIEHGPTSLYGQFYQDATPKTSHSYTISGLDPQALYHYQIIAPAAAGRPTGYSDDRSFRTPINFSNIFEARAVNGSAYDYTITFDTDVDVQCVVEWGLDVGYGETPIDAGSGTSHQAVITGILPGQTFYWRAVGNSSLDPAYQPVNLPARDPGHQIVAPEVVISNLQAVPDMDTGLTCLVTWATNYETDVNTVYYRIVGQPTWQTASDNTPASEHSVTLVSLTTDSQYEYYVESSTATLVPGNSLPVKYFYTFVPKNGINNPGFETGDLSGWVPYEYYGDTYGTGENNGLPAMPEVRSNWIAYPFSDPYEGSYSCGLQSEGRTKNGGVYQRFYPSGANNYVAASAWVLGLSRAWDDSASQQDNSMVRLGVDPTGGVDRTSPNVAWTPWTCTKEWWHQVKVGFAPSGIATLFVEGTQYYPIGRVVACWDDIALSTTPPVQLLAQPTITVPGDQSLAEPTALVEWQTDVPSTTQIYWDLDGPSYLYWTSEDTNLVTDHSVLLTGLSSDQLHHLQVVSTAAGYDPLSSADRFFQTLPEAAAEILNWSFEGTGEIGRTQLWPWKQYTVDPKVFHSDPTLGDAAAIDGLITGHPYGGPSWFNVTAEPDGGSSFIGAASSYGTPKNGGVWQRVELQPGESYGLSARIYTHQVGGDPEDTECWLGVDTTGGIDPYSPTVQWAGSRSLDQWGSVGLSFTADGVTTIFCHLKNWWSLEWHVNAIDKVQFIEPVDDIYAGKTGPAGSPVELTGQIVTASFLGEDGLGGYLPIGFGIQTPDRAIGIRVVSTATVTPGDVVDVNGTCALVDGELVIQASNVSVTSAGSEPVPFSITNIDSAGGALGSQPAVVNNASINKMAVGMNSVGSLLKISGKVTAVNDDGTYGGYFYVDDAYSDPWLGFDTGLTDGSGNVGIKCRPAMGLFGMPGALPAVGDYVEVTGVMGVQQIGGKNARFMWTKDWTTASFASRTRNHVAKWTLLSLPAQPKFADPAIVFGSEVMPDPDKIDGRLYRWDGPSQSLGMYDMWAPDLFGPITASEGYWLNAAAAGTVNYTGYAESPSLDRWISAPAGWKLLGNPFTHNTWWGDWSATDGSAMKSIFDASQYGSGWMQSIGYWWNDSTQSLSDLGLMDDFPQSEQLNSWYGYWVKTSKSLGLIAPQSSYAP